METRIKTRPIALILLSTALLLISGKSVSAQEIPGRFHFSVSANYSPKTDADTYELGVGYLLGNAAININYGRIGLFDGRTAHGETISLFIPTFSTQSFSMMPEVAAGILHGYIESGESTAVKPQIQVGVRANYRISSWMSCGITYKTIHYSGGTIPLYGWNIMTHF